MLRKTIRGFSADGVIEGGCVRQRVFAAVDRSSLRARAGGAVRRDEAALQHRIERKEGSLSLLKGLHAERGCDGVVEVRLIVPAEANRNRREEVRFGTEVSTLAVAQTHFIVVVM